MTNELKVHKVRKLKVNKVGFRWLSGEGGREIDFAVYYKIEK